MPPSSKRHTASPCFFHPRPMCAFGLVVLGALFHLASDLPLLIGDSQVETTGDKKLVYINPK